jgi:hypothetical protein
MAVPAGTCVFCAETIYGEQPAVALVLTEFRPAMEGGTPIMFAHRECLRPHVHESMEDALDDEEIEY